MNKRHLKEAVGQAVKANDPTKSGYKAGLAGRSEDANPHRPGSETWKKWSSGWYQGFTDRPV